MIGGASRLRPRDGAMRPDGRGAGRLGRRALAFAERILLRLRRTSPQLRRLDRVMLSLGRPGVAMRPPVHIRLSPVVQLHLHAAAGGEASTSRTTATESPRQTLMRLRAPAAAAAAPTAIAAPAMALAATQGRAGVDPARSAPARPPVAPRAPQPPPPMERVYARVTPAPEPARDTPAAPAWQVTPTTVLPPLRGQAATAPNAGADLSLSRAEIGRVAEDVMGLLERRFLAARERFGGR